MSAAGAAIYLDHNATTPPDAAVCAAMAEVLASAWGNPSSVHAVGRRARRLVEDARGEVAALLGCAPEEIVFTSGGSEGNHLVVRGLGGGRWGRVVTSELEHPSLRAAVQASARAGARVREVEVDDDGRIAVQAVAAALREAGEEARTAPDGGGAPDHGPDTLVTLAMVNHELGNLYDVAGFARAARAVGALVHSDLVQAAGRVPVDVRALDLDAATVSAHKLHGPKGVGAVYVRAGRVLEPLVAGGHQEYERRAGTENVAGIVGFGVAARLARDRLAHDAARIAALRDRLEAGLLALPGARRWGDARARAPGTCNVGFAGLRAERVVIALDLAGVCVSAGAACTSGSQQRSPVIARLCRAAGLPSVRADEAVRFSLGRGTTEADADAALAAVAEVVARLRAAAGAPL